MKFFQALVLVLFLLNISQETINAITIKEKIKTIIAGLITFIIYYCAGTFTKLL